MDSMSYQTDEDRAEGVSLAADYRLRTPEHEVEEWLSLIGRTPRTLVSTNDGQKGWITSWTYDGLWNPVLVVTLFMPRYKGVLVDYYYADELTPVWGPPCPRVVLTRAVMTCAGGPSQWDAWDADGVKYYLRYRFGIGTVQVGSVSGVVISDFDTGDGLDGEMTLPEFAELAGLGLAL